MESHLIRVQHAEPAWTANTDPHIAAAVVPRAREDAFALKHGRICGGGSLRDEDARAGAPMRVVGVDRACRMDPVRVRVSVGEGYGFRGGEGAYALRRAAAAWRWCGGPSTARRRRALFGPCRVFVVCHGLVRVGVERMVGVFSVGKVHIHNFGSLDSGRR